MGDVLVHGPALQAVEVLVQPHVRSGTNVRPALQALVDYRAALDHSPLDATGGDHEIECPLHSRIQAVDFAALQFSRYLGTSASRATGTGNLDLFRWTELWVLGSVAEAQKGALLVLFGGTREQLTRCDEVLGSLGREPYYVGPVGKAAVLKLALNQLIAAEMAAFSLSLALVQQEHVDVELFMAVLRKSALFAPAFDKKLPRLLSRDYSSPNFSVQHLVKDVHFFWNEHER